MRIREVKRIGTQFIARKVHVSGIEFLPFWYELTTDDSFLQCHTWGRLQIKCAGCEVNWCKWKDNYCGCWQNGPWEWQWAESVMYLLPEVCFTALSIDFGFDGKIFRWLIFISSRLRSHPLLTLCRRRNGWMNWGSVDLRRLQYGERDVTYVTASSTVQWWSSTIRFFYTD
jgi:hypothetical protein